MPSLPSWNRSNSNNSALFQTPEPFHSYSQIFALHIYFLFFAFNPNSNWLPSVLALQSTFHFLFALTCILHPFKSCPNDSSSCFFPLHFIVLNKYSDECTFSILLISVSPFCFPFLCLPFNHPHTQWALFKSDRKCEVWSQ